MLTKMFYWNDLHSVSPDRKDQAVQSLKELRNSFDRYGAQQEYQQEREHKMHLAVSFVSLCLRGSNVELWMKPCLCLKP